MKKDELTRLQNAYDQLKLMGFSHGEILELLEGKGDAPKQITSKEAIDVMTLYFRAKKLLADSHVREVMRGNEHLKGAATLPRDVGVLYAYESFVDSLENAIVVRNAGSGKKESMRTWDNYFKEKEADYARHMKNKGKATRKQKSTYEDIKENPYDDRIKDYLETYMDAQTISDVTYAVNSDPSALAIVRGLPFAVGRNKQESYTDVVLKYMYADTAVSREKAKNLRLEKLNAELKKKLQESGDTGAKITAAQVAIIAALGASSTKALEAIKSMEGKMDARLDTVMGAIITNGRARKREHAVQNRMLSHINKKLTVGLIAGGAAAAILFASTFGLYFDKADNSDPELLAANAAYSRELGELDAFHKAYGKLIADGRVDAAELAQLIAARDGYVKTDVSGQYSSTSIMDTMIEAAKAREAHTDADLKPSNYADILADAAKQARFASFMNEYKARTPDGLTGTELSELQTIVNAESDAGLKASMQEILNLAVNQGGAPADYAEQKARADYGFQEGNDYMQFLKDLEKAKADGTITQAEFDDMAKKITGVYAANDIASYGYASTPAMTALVNAEFDLSKANGQINALSIEVNNLNGQISKLTEQQKKDAATIAGLQATIADKEARIAELEALLANGSGNDAVIKDLQAQLKGVKDELAAAKSQVTALQSENAGLKQENADLKAENAQLKQDVAALQSQVNSLTTDSASLKAQVEDLKNKNNQLANQVASYMTQLEQAKTDFAALQSQYNDLKAKYDALVQASQGMVSQAEVDALRARITELEGSLSKALSDLAASESALAKAVQEGAANGKFLDDLYAALTYTSSGTMTDAEVREYIAFMLGLNYSENTSGNENDHPSYGG